MLTFHKLVSTATMAMISGMKGRPAQSTGKHGKRGRRGIPRKGSKDGGIGMHDTMMGDMPAIPSPPWRDLK